MHTLYAMYYFQYSSVERKTLPVIISVTCRCIDRSGGVFGRPVMASVSVLELHFLVKVSSAATNSMLMFIEWHR